MNSWNQLLSQARHAAPPADIDLRAAVRQQLTHSSHLPAPSSMWVELALLLRWRWFQLGLSALACGSVLLCRETLTMVDEFALLWQMQGPVWAGI